jgi:hypothetical protein
MDEPLLVVLARFDQANDMVFKPPGFTRIDESV